MNSSDKINYLKTKLRIIKNYYQVKDFDSVIEKSKIVIKKFPHETIFYNSLGLAYKEKGELDLAEKILKKGLKLNPKEINILSNLGLISKFKKDFKNAQNYFEKSLAISPKHIPSIVNFANLKKDLGFIEESIVYFLSALKINDQLPEVHINLAIIYKSIGKFNDTIKHCQILNEKFPDLIIADNLLSQVTDYAIANTHQNIMLEKIKSNNLSIMDKIYLNFAIAKSFEDQREYNVALNYLDEGNKLKRKSLINYKFDDEIYFFDKIKEIKINSTLRVNAEPSKKLIFILGLPRSGTTLAHQIISGSSNVFGAGELSYFNYLKNSKKINSIIEENNKPLIDEIRHNFLNKINDLNITEEIIVDKTPENFMWIGLIKLIFPEAKIIHCRRQIKDTALSIYKNLFHGSAYSWSYNKDELTNYIKLYLNIIDFWDNKFPQDIFHSNYETLVKNPEIESKKIFNFCGLKWDNKFLNIEKSKTPINTLSSTQARKPIYNKSIDYYKNFENLNDFFNKLDF